MPGIGRSKDPTLLARKNEMLRSVLFLAIGFAAGSGLWYRSNSAALAEAQSRAFAARDAAPAAAPDEDDSLGGWFRRALGLGSQPGRRAPRAALAPDSETQNPFPKRAPAPTLAGGPLGGPAAGTAEGAAGGGSGTAAAAGVAAPTTRPATPTSARRLIAATSLTPAYYPQDGAEAAAGSGGAANAAGAVAAARSAAAGVEATVAAGTAGAGRETISDAGVGAPTAGPGVPSANGGGYGCTSACSTGLCDWNGNCCPAGSIVTQQTNCGGSGSQAQTQTPAPAATAGQSSAAGTTAPGGTPIVGSGANPIPAPAPAVNPVPSQTSSPSPNPSPPVGGPASSGPGDPATGRSSGH